MAHSFVNPSFIALEFSINLLYLLNAHFSLLTLTKSRVMISWKYSDLLSNGCHNNFWNILWEDTLEKFMEWETSQLTNLGNRKLFLYEAE